MGYIWVWNIDHFEILHFDILLNNFTIRILVGDFVEFIIINCDRSALVRFIFHHLIKIWTTLIIFHNPNGWWCLEVAGILQRPHTKLSPFNRYYLWHPMAISDLMTSWHENEDKGWIWIESVLINHSYFLYRGRGRGHYHNNILSSDWNNNDYTM